MKILFVSLGCDKNLVDTEHMLGLLAQHGFSFTYSEEEADVVIINTCCFIGDAKEESVNELLAYAALKEDGQIKALLVCGCLAQRYREEILTEIPQVDAVLGTNSIQDIVLALEKVLAQKDSNLPEAAPGAKGACADRTTQSARDAAIADKLYLRSLSEPQAVFSNRIVTSGGHFAYLKIADGCEKFCTYCIIPKLRGPYKSLPMEDLLQEAKMLADQGVRELILVAQETTIYGVDLYGKKMLPTLLRKLAQIDGLYWIRILYCYPEEITEELMEVIATEPKVCHYLDLPIQHGADPVLRRMGRRTSQAQLRAVIEKLRARIPDICLRTTLISGFPGESQEDFEECYRFVNDLEFDRLGVFAYSREEDTPAAAMSGQIPEDVKAFRRDELMTLQQEISLEKSQEFIGKILDVIIEGRAADEDIYVARTYRDAPDVDGYLFLHTGANLMSGDFAKVLVTDANEYDLIGELFHED